MKLSFLSNAGGASTNLTAPTATWTYKYYMHGDDIGYFRWYWSAGTSLGTGTLTLLRGIYDGTSATEVSGEKQSNGNQSWKSGTIDLVANGIKGSGRMVLLYAKSANTGFRGDACFQRMKMNIQGHVTDLSPPSSTYTGWRGQDIGDSGMDPSTDMEPEWENGNLYFNTVSTTVYTNGPWSYRTNAVPSGCSNTGPCQEDGSDGSYYMFVETSNNSYSNMYYAFRYCFVYTLDTFTI